MGITDMSKIIFNLGFKYNKNIIRIEDGYNVLYITGFFNRWYRIPKEQIMLLESMLSHRYKIKIVRKFYKWTIWEQFIVGKDLF